MVSLVEFLIFIKTADPFVHCTSDIDPRTMHVAPLWAVTVAEDTHLPAIGMPNMLIGFQFQTLYFNV